MKPYIITDELYNYVFSGSSVGFPSQLGAFEYCNYTYPIGSVCGTSGGAINASLIATSNTIQEMTEKLYSIDIPNLIDYYHVFKVLSLPALLDNNKKAIIAGNKIHETFKKIFPQKFKDLKTDLTIVCTDINRRIPVVFNKKTTPDEDIAFALRASISIPLAFSPVKYKDTWLVDGGLTQNFYLRNFINEKNIIGIKFNDLDDYKPVTTTMELFFATLFTAIIENENENIRDVPQAKLLDITIDVDMFAFDKLDKKTILKLYQNGYNQAIRNFK